MINEFIEFPVTLTASYSYKRYWLLPKFIASYDVEYSKKGVFQILKDSITRIECVLSPDIKLIKNKSRIINALGESVVVDVSVEKALSLINKTTPDKDMGFKLKKEK